MSDASRLVGEKVDRVEGFVEGVRQLLQETLRRNPAAKLMRRLRCRRQDSNLYRLAPRGS